MSGHYSDIDETFDPEVIVNPDKNRYNRVPQPETRQEEQPRPQPEPRPEPKVVEERQPDPREEKPEPVAEKAPSPKINWWKAIRDSRTAMFMGIVLLVVSLYAFIVSVSYFFNIGHDQSALLGGDLEPASIDNAGGPVGAWLAHSLLYNWLGIGAFVIIFYTGALGLSLLGVKRFKFWNLTFSCLLTAVAVSIIGGFVTWEMSSPIYWGGRHGHFLNGRLVELAGVWGALGLSVIMAGALVMLFLDWLKNIWRWCSRRTAAVNARLARQRAERQARLDEERRQEELEAKERADREAAEAEKKAEEERQAEAEKKTVNDIPPVAEEKKEPQLQSQGRPTAPKEEKVNPLFRAVTPIDEVVIEDEPIQQDLFANPDADDFESETDDDEIVEINTLVEDEDPAEEAPLFTVETPEIEEVPATLVDKGNDSVYDPTAELSRFQFPSIELLHERAYQTDNVDAEEMEENKQRITKTLNDYGIPISHIQATVGPTVTLYEIIPAEGVRIAKIKRLEDDIALSLAALGIRIIAPIPGKGTIGIEVPNKDPQTVSMRSVIASRRFQEKKNEMGLPMAMGCTISNDVFIADLCKMPHLLVAGATGMGKSVGLNTIIASLLYTKHPAELKFVLVDPKMVEFSLYARLENHYLAKLPDEEDAIITDPSKVVATLNSLCVEMDNRYALLRDAACRNLKEYNDKFVHRHLNPEKGHRFMPYIVVIVDEFADLIMTAGKEVEMPIARLAQKARAVGMHVILATQRPSTNVITGIIKANFPGRIAFRVFQMVDSRTILDRPGANQLIGRGDMLFSNNGKIDRVQCAFIDTDEVEAICEAIGNQPGYGHAYELPEYVPESDGSASVGNLTDRDPLFDEAARLVVSTDTASTSSLQRRYSIGYNRAGKIMDQMEAAGIVGPSQGGKPRQVLVDPMTLEHILSNQA